MELVLFDFFSFIFILGFHIFDRTAILGLGRCNNYCQTSCLSFKPDFGDDLHSFVNMYETTIGYWTGQITKLGNINEEHIKMVCQIRYIGFCYHFRANHCDLFVIQLFHYMIFLLLSFVIFGCCFQICSVLYFCY